MLISFTIPKIVIWILGGVLGLGVLILAALGVTFVVFMKGFRIR
jgi:hypothetical protein